MNVTLALGKQLKRFGAARCAELSQKVISGLTIFSDLIFSAADSYIIDGKTQLEHPGYFFADDP